MIIGFTGTDHGMTLLQKKGVRHILWYEQGRDNTEDVFHHGDCIGADEQAATIAWELGWSIVQHPPILEKSRFDWRPSGISKIGQVFTLLQQKHYIARNHDIVNAAHRMIATPGIIEELRSGTWATIRYTREKKIPLSIVWPTGEITHDRFAPNQTSSQ